MVNLQKIDSEVEKIYDLIKQHKGGITVREIAAGYPARDATAPYAVAQLIADKKIRTEQRGDGVYCLAVHEFEQYIQQYSIDPVKLSTLAQIRYSVVWHAMRGYPILQESAQKIKNAVFQVTGIPYTGPFALIQANTGARDANKQK